MPRPRKQIVSLDATSYYHCMSQCVRRAFLCGFDAFSGKSYEHRREWVEQRILFLGTVFAIDICAYAVMSNHHHVILHIDKPKSLHWSNEDVCERWHKIYKGTPLTQKYLRRETLSGAEMLAVQAKLDEWRLNLCSISWFMKALNEPIARMANAEDQCTGKFFESRFKSQALLDDKALLACMTYVDLNPVRAKMADTPEQSDHTSIKARLEAAKGDNAQPTKLAKFVGNPTESTPSGLPFHFKDYMDLVDWTGRIVRTDKRGAIDANLPPILERLAIEPEYWVVLTTQFESRFKSLVGCAYQLKRAARALGFKRTPGLTNCKAAFS